MTKRFSLSTLTQYLPYFLLGVIGLVLIHNLTYPLHGMHKVRQADTLMTSYLFCKEEANLFEPRVAFRGDSPKGISIGELPLFSYVVSLPCQLTGTWSDITPKFLTYLFFAFGLLLWVFTIFSDPLKRKSYAFIALSLSSIITYTLIPIPDAFVFFLFALAAFTVDRLKNTIPVVSFAAAGVALVLMVTGFLIRPYFIFLLPYLFYLKRHPVYGVAILACFPSYYWWFKTILPTGELTGYYYTGMPSIGIMIKEFPGALLEGVYALSRDQFGFTGLIFFVLGSKKNYLISLYSLLSIVIFIFLRGDHINSHQYYLIAISLILIHIMTEGMVQLPWRKASWILSGMLISLIISDQHHWHPVNVDIPKLQQYVNTHSREDERICMLNFGLTEGFYYAKRTGWALGWPHFAQTNSIHNPWPHYTCPPQTLLINRDDFKLFEGP